LRLAAALAALLVALAAPGLAAPQGPPPGPGPGAGPGGPPDGPAGRGAWGERTERRLRLARSLGLAEALELDEAQTARMNAVMAPFDARRKAVLEGVAADVRTLRQAARKADPKALAAVDGAVQRIFEARAANLGIDREMFAALSRDMPPEKVARMALFFARFRQRFGMEMHDAPTPAPR
jgi:hypothetical protein